MDCQRAEKGLKKLALSGAAAADSPEVAAHLAACAVCAEAFAREQSFVAAMNRGVAATVAGEPSPALRARVREQLAAPLRRWELRWAVVAAATLMVLVFSLRALHSRRTQPGQNVSLPSGEIAAVAPAANSSPATTTRLTSLLSRKRAGDKPSPLPDFPPVLIEKGEREATIRFLNEVRGGRVDLASLAAAPELGSLEALDITPLEIPALAISPIVKNSSTPRTESEP